MTNRNMVSGGAQRLQPNEAPMPAVPATEDAATPTTREDPIDSPQPNPHVGREPPSARKQGLATKR